MYDLQEIEAIKRLKYRYFRCLDLKLWDELRDCFVEDATTAYAGGKLSFQGRDKIMEFLVGALGRHSMLTHHHGHHPEIELTSPTSATGVWALQDVVIDTQNKITIYGASFYHDEYVKLGGGGAAGGWKFRSTGYQRTYEALESLADRPSYRLTANRFAE